MRLTSRTVPTPDPCGLVPESACFAVPHASGARNGALARAPGLLYGAALALCIGCGSEAAPKDGAASSSDSGSTGSVAAQGGTGGATMDRSSVTTAGDGSSGGQNSGSEAAVQVTSLTGNEGNGGGSGGNAGSDGTDPAGAGGSGGAEADPVVVDERPFFSFFATSQAGMYGLPAGDFAPAPDPAIGYGGNLGGLAGADEICTLLARQSNGTDTKIWRAFLSTSGFNGGDAVDAIDRIGTGPWYDFNGRLFAEDIAGLIPEGNDGRPQGADPQLAEMFTDENGDDSQPNNDIDNHDTLTGSGVDGRLFDDGDGGSVATCEDWTSTTVRGNEGNQMGNGGQIPVGHSWPRNNRNGRHWMSDHTINGCEAGFDIDGGGGAAGGDFRVGAGGGFGGIYCFALDAVAPQ